MTKKKLSFFVVGIAMANAVFAGNRDGAGGDLRSEYSGAAWFPGPKKITYCYDGNLGLGKGEIEGILKKAFEIWREYIDKKQVFGTTLSDKAVPAYANHFDTEPVMRKCTGEEELKFYLGT